MTYAALLEQALSEAPSGSSLEHVLSRIDEQNKIVPTFEEFTVAVARGRSAHALEGGRATDRIM